MRIERLLCLRNQSDLVLGGKNYELMDKKLVRLGPSSSVLLEYFTTRRLQFFGIFHCLLFGNIDFIGWMIAEILKTNREILLDFVCTTSFKIYCLERLSRFFMFEKIKYKHNTNLWLVSAIIRIFIIWWYWVSWWSRGVFEALPFDFVMFRLNIWKNWQIYELIERLFRH